MIDAIIKIVIHLFSSAVFVVLLRIIGRLENKKYLHRVCALNVQILFVWTVSRLLNEILFYFIGYRLFFVFLLASISVFFLPSTLALLTILMIKDRVNSPGTYAIIFIPPLTSTALFVTNSLHKLFFTSYSAYDNSITAGPYYYVHCTWQLVFATFSVIYIIYSSLKYTNCLSKQILLVVTGMVAPIAVDYLVYLNYFSSLPLEFPSYIHTISYCFTAICLTVAIYKYRFLDIIPIAVKSIIDNISDSFIVIDNKHNIIEINKPFIMEFGKFIKVSNTNLSELLENDIFMEFNKQIHNHINHSKLTLTNSRLEHPFVMEGDIRYFSIDVTPILIHKRLMGILILLKNITEHKQVLKLIEENTNQMIEKARLMSLNQLIGGIAHNIKSPLMASSGGILSLTKHTKEIDQLFDKLSLYSSHPEYVQVINNMKKWEDTIKQQLVYISDIITAVKDQATHLNSDASNSFSVKKILDRVTILMEFELKKAGCSLNKVLNLDPETEIEGDITVLTQVLNNIIINAIQAYDDGGGVDLTASQSGNEIHFIISDHGKGIEKEVKDRIFHQMVTTKGKDGTGLGLYIANIAVKGQFRGSIGIESEVGKGTSVYVSISQKRKKNISDSAAV